MKKLIFPFIYVFLALALTSCTAFLSGDNSISLTFNKDDFYPSSRAITADEDTKLLVIASVLGDYQETQSLEFSDFTTFTVSFDSIPSGASVYADVNIYYPNDDYSIHTFTGTSSQLQIQSGENETNVTMQNLQDYTDSDPVNLYGNSEENMGAFVFQGYKNGKYIILYSSSVDYVLSEGLWKYTEDFSQGAKVYVKEHAYKTYKLESCEPTDLSDTYIEEVPEWKSFTVKQGEYSTTTYIEIGENKALN